MFTRIKSALEKQAQLYTYVAGSAVVTIWTLLRFFDQRMTFDLVGQQVLTHQWLQGHLSGATIGPTNYILKMLLLYIPLDLLPGSPRLKLILLAIVINIVTFICIGLLLNRLLRLFGIKSRLYGYVGMLWLSVLAGSVFWIQFSNSRNLEVVGGLWLIERGLTYIQKPSRTLGLGIAGLATVLFFADGLQVYMVAMPLLIYSSVLAFKQQQYVRQVAYLAGALLLGFVLSKLFMHIAEHVFVIQFLSGQTQKTQLSIHSLARSLKGVAVSLAHQFAGANDAGRSREAANLVLTGLLAGGFVYAAIRKYIPKRLVLFVSTFIITDILVYIASGQALIAGTSRYLIMLVPVALLVFGSLAKLAVPKKIHISLLSVISIVLLINIIGLGRSLSTHWDTNFPLDGHLYSAQRFVTQGNYKFAYASMDTAMPLNYLDHTTMYLPLNCTGGQLLKSHLFFDSSAFTQEHVGSAARFIPVILDQKSINNQPATCSLGAIIDQLGTPAQIDSTDDGSAVLLYSAKTFMPPERFN